MRRVVTVVSKEGCHLCERVVEALDSMSSRYDLEVRVLDIGRDAQLTSKYALSVPVVQIDGKDVFEARDMTIDSGYFAKLERLVKP
jgi:glutaredoxin